MRVFSETQRSNQWWMKLIVVALLAFVVFCLHTWFIAKESTGNVMVTDTTGPIIVIVSLIAPLVLLLAIKLRTSIDEIGIHYQFLPFHLSKKTVRWNKLEKCYVRTYSPIKEYEGWGYRTSFGKKKGSVFNVKGNRGIQLEFKTDKIVLIGTQKDSEATEVINRYFDQKP